MSDAIITVKVMRFDPARDQKPYFQSYTVPYVKGMSSMDALDYIYQNLDSTISYYDHAACSLGICGRCVGKTNGKAGLLCQTPVHGNIVLEPIKRKNLLKDLVVKKSIRDKGTT